MHFGEKYTLRELRDRVRDDFIIWYRSATPAISAIERQTFAELHGFGDQLQPHQLVKLAIRRKSEDSFADKISKMLRDPSEFKSLEKTFGGRKEIGPEGLVKDLIGARFIMYSGPDQLLPIQFLSFRQEFTVSELKIYSIYDRRSPFFPVEYHKAMTRLFPNVPIQIGQKPSGYESIHAIVRYNPNYLRMRASQFLEVPPKKHPSLDRKPIVHSDADQLRCITSNAWDRLGELEQQYWPKKAKEGRFITRAQNHYRMTVNHEISLLDKLDFEIQIRTSLQDNWAQIEHRLRYSVEKSSSGQTPVGNRDLVDQAFKAQTVMTSALEKNQNLVLRIDGQKYEQVAISLQTLAAGKRGAFFSEDKGSIETFNQVNKIYNEIDRGLQDEKQRKGPSETTALLNEIEKLGNVVKIDFRKFTADDDVMMWGKRRYILLMLGYLLLKGNSDIKEKIVHWFTYDSEKSRMPLEAYWAANYIYDHVRFLDTNFRWKQTAYRNYFYDPLVAYRAAGLAVQRREFFRAISTLDEAVNVGFLERFEEMVTANLRVLNRARFERRCGQYYWWAYLANRSENVDSLFYAIDRMQNVLQMKNGDIIRYQINGLDSSEEAPLKRDILRHEQRWAVLSLIVYNFFRYILRRDGIPNVQAFDEVLQKNLATAQKLFPGAGSEMAKEFIKQAKPDFLGQMALVEGIAKASYGNISAAIADVETAIQILNRSPRRLESAFDRAAIAEEIRKYLKTDGKQLAQFKPKDKRKYRGIELYRSGDVAL